MNQQQEPGASHPALVVLQPCLPRSPFAQVGQLFLHWRVVARLHAERRRAARDIAQVRRVAEQLRERNVRVDLAAALVRREVQDLASTAVDVAGGAIAWFKV